LREDFFFELAIHLLSQADALFLGYGSSDFLVEHLLKNFGGVVFFKKTAFGNGFVHGLEHGLDEDRLEILAGFFQRLLVLMHP